MKRKVVGRFGRGVFCILCLSLFALISVAVCSCDKKEEPGAQEGMNISFGKDGMIRTGTEFLTYQVEEGEQGVLSVCIARTSGRIDVDVYRVGNEENPDYVGRDLDSASFQVIVSVPGEYRICVTAKKYVGDYEFGWKTEARAAEYTAADSGHVPNFKIRVVKSGT